MKASDYHRSEQQLILGRFELDALIRAWLGLRTRALGDAAFDRRRPDEPLVDFEDTMPAARPSVGPMS